MTYTRQQIDAIEVGHTKIAHGIDGRFGEATLVVEIYAKQEDIHGKLFVCGYRDYGSHNGRISFSIKEGDASDARHYRIEPRPATYVAFNREGRQVNVTIPQ